MSLLSWAAAMLTQHNYRILYSPTEIEKPPPETPPLTQVKLDGQYPPDLEISAPIDGLLQHDRSVMVRA